MKINVLGIVKGVSELAVSAGVGTVVGNLVKATTPYDLSKTQKVLVAVGGYGLGAVLGDLTAKYISDQIDGYAERVSSIIHPSEETVEAAQDLAEDAADAKDALIKDGATIIESLAPDHVVKEAKKQEKPVVDETD